VKKNKGRNMRNFDIYTRAMAVRAAMSTASSLTSLLSLGRRRIFDVSLSLL